MLWWFVGSAHAWSLTGGGVWDLDLAATHVGLAERDGAPIVLIATGGSVQVRDGAGALVAERVGGASAVAAEDLDGDGLVDLLICDGRGLTLVPWGGSGFGASVTIDPTPCVAVHRSDLGGDGVAVVGEDGVVHLWMEIGSAFSGPVPTGLSVGGPPLLGARPGSLAAASPGDVTLQEADDWGVSQLAAGGPIAGLALRDDWVLALGGDDPRLRELGGEVIALDGRPVAVAVGDADGDGIDDLWVLQPDESRLVVYAAAGEVRSYAGIVGDRLAVGDLDGDGCADAVVSEPGVPTLAVVHVAGCPLVADLDGDGWDPDAGDCDDADPDVHPEAFEHCNGADDDCDGEVDESDAIVVRVPIGAREGDTVVAWAEVPGCAELEPTLSLVFDPWLASCVIAEGEAVCDLFDDGTVLVVGEALDADGVVVFREEASFEVENVAPVILWGGSAPDGDIELVEGGSWSAQLDGFDPGNDELDYRVTVDDDAGLSVTPSGLLVVNARSAGDWDFEVRIADDDGGSTRYDLWLYVEAEDTGWEDDDDSDCGDLGCGDPCGGTSCAIGLPLLALGLGLRRRRG